MNRGNSEEWNPLYILIYSSFQTTDTIPTNNDSVTGKAKSVKSEQMQMKIIG